MKKTFIILLLTLSLSTLTFAQTLGELSVTTTTSSAGGMFSPNNVLAIWVEDDAGNFVKTLMVYAQFYTTYLNTWEASTNAAGDMYNSVDAITGASRTSHGIRTCAWDGKDVSGIDMPDGTYYVWMELTDRNNTGNFSSFMFTKDDNTNTLTPSNVPSFSSISIEWSPLVGVENSKFRDYHTYSVYPNPAKNQINIESPETIKEINIYNDLGQMILNLSLNVKQTQIPLDLNSGLYFINIVAETEVYNSKLIISN